MSKSYECSILGLYHGIFQDIAIALPTVRGLERDENRLLSTVQSRGFRFLTIDMPAFGKHFDRCLADGRLTPSGITNFGMTGRRQQGPAFLRGLLSRVFDRNGMLLAQPCVTSIFFIRQLCNAAKKIKMECTEKVRETTLQRYLDQERSLRSPSLDWHGDYFDHRSGDSLRIDDFRNCDRGQPFDLFEAEGLPRGYCDTVHDIADRVASSFGVFDPLEWRPKHGPGAVADGTKATYKYKFPTWSARLETVFPSCEFAFANYAAWSYSVQQGDLPQEVDLPSVALTVPKTQKAPRIIAKEPTANMWCQQIVRDYLETNVSRTFLKNCIHFRDQTFNGSAALQASKDQKHWTVDLSDASDRVSLWLVERLFRRNPTLLEALFASRSIYCRVKTKRGTNFIKMKKFAPQGAATTFPLQTIIYAILAISSVIYTRGWRVNAKTISRASKEVLVFGDDTLVPEDCGRQYVELLTYCGFIVNKSKTYGTGKFRESCGVEAYDGADVTPAYVTEPYRESDPSTVASTVECANNFYMKGLTHAAAALESTLPQWIRNNLLRVGPGDGRFGLVSFFGFKATPFKRWNRKLQREETRALRIESRVTRAQPGGVGHLLQYFTEAPTQDIHWMSGLDSRPACRVSKRWEAILS